MSLADYTSLKTAISTDWLHRSDMTSQVDDFIDLFESDFNATMRVRQMEASTTLATTTGFITHPTSWLGWKLLTLTAAGITYALEQASNEYAVDATVGQTTVTTPKYFKVKGTRTYFWPSPSGAASINTNYWEGVALSGGTNWLLTSYPGAYLYGTLLQATAAIGDDPRIPMWQGAYEQILDRIRRDSRRGEWSGQTLSMKPDTGTP